MKILSLIFVFVFFGSIFLMAQYNENCTPGEEEFTWEDQIGGYVLPSEGTLNVLIIFAQFPDDNHDPNCPSWIKGQAPTDRLIKHGVLIPLKVP